MKFKKLIRSGAALLLAGTISGCSIKIGTNKEPAADTVVAKPTSGDATDSLKVTYEEFKKEYVYYLKSHEIEDDTAESVAAQCKTQRKSIINYLINEKVIFLKAKELGVLTLTPEEQNSVDEKYNSQIDEQVSYFGENASYDTSDGESVTDDEKLERGNKEFDAFLEDCGLTRDDLLAWVTSSAVTTKLIDEVGKSLDYADAEKIFNDYAEEIKTMYETDVSQYEQGGYYEVWVPEGARLIKHILLGFEEDVQDEITTLRQGGKESEANALREEKAEELHDKIEEVQKKLDDGEDFTKIMLEYSNDSAGSSMYPDGYTVVPNGKSYMAEFQEAAFVPEKIGDRTVCVTDYGVHIMIYSGDAKVTDEAKKSFTDYVFEQQKQSEFSRQMEEWVTSYSFDIDYDSLRLDKPEENSENSNEN